MFNIIITNSFEIGWDVTIIDELNGVILRNNTNIYYSDIYELLEHIKEIIKNYEKCKKNDVVLYN